MYSWATKKVDFWDNPPAAEVICQFIASADAAWHGGSTEFAQTMETCRETISTIPAGVFDGAANALSTVTAFFVGESDTDGIFAVLKKALSVAVVGGGVLAILCGVFSDSLVWFFGIRDGATIEKASAALRIFACSIVFTGINTVVTAFWQSIERAKFAGAMSVIRNCLLLLAAGAFMIPKANE